MLNIVTKHLFSHLPTRHIVTKHSPPDVDTRHPKIHAQSVYPASGAVLILAAILDLVLVLVFRRKCILVLVTFSHFYPA